MGPEKNNSQKKIRSILAGFDEKKKNDETDSSTGEEKNRSWYQV